MIDIIFPSLIVSIFVGLVAWTIYLSLGLWPLRHRLKILLGLLGLLVLLGLLGRNG